MYAVTNEHTKNNRTGLPRTSLCVNIHICGISTCVGARFVRRRLNLLDAEYSDHYISACTPDGVDRCLPFIGDKHSNRSQNSSLAHRIRKHTHTHTHTFRTFGRGQTFPLQIRSHPAIWLGSVVGYFHRRQITNCQHRKCQHRKSNWFSKAQNVSPVLTHANNVNTHSHTVAPVRHLVLVPQGIVMFDMMFMTNTLLSTVRHLHKKHLLTPHGVDVS